MEENSNGLVRIFRKLGGLQKLRSFIYLFFKIVGSGIQGEDAETFLKNSLEFNEARITGSDDMGAEAGVIGGLGDLVAWEICLIIREEG